MFKNILSLFSFDLSSKNLKTRFATLDIPPSGELRLSKLREIFHLIYYD